MKYLVINDVRLTLEVEAEDANHAVRQARDAELSLWQVGDQDEIEVYDETGQDIAEDWDWGTVEDLLMEARAAGLPIQYRIDHYFAIEGGGEIEEGHVFCTPAEGEEIKGYLEKHLVHEDSTAETVVVEGGGEYDYTTEEATALDIAKSICQTSGFHFDEDDTEDTK